MAGSINTEQTATAQRTTIRVDLLLPAVMLLLAGFAVTFTQDFHNELGLNKWIIAAFGILYGITQLIPSPAKAGATRSMPSALLAGISIVLGLAAPFAPSTDVLAMFLLLWASITTVVSLWNWVQTRERDVITNAIIAGLLAIILAFAARSLPAVMGFFAAYCIIVGVHLGIASLDRTARAVAPEPEAA